MGNFQRDDNRGGGFRGGNGGGRPSFGGGNRGGDRGPVTMHKAVCDECHKSCEVPFRPSGDKPIYCSDCFGSKRGNDDRGPRRDFNDRGPKKDFNDRPASSQSSSFAKPASTGMGNDMSKQLSEMNSKLDRLIKAIEKFPQPKTVATPVMKVSAPVVAKAPAMKVVAKAKVLAKAPAKKVVVKKGKK